MTLCSIKKALLLIAIPALFILVSHPTLAQSRLSFNPELSRIGSNSDNNFARTKDADIGDINADGFPDIIDLNSNNETNRTNLVIRFNSNGRTFRDEIVRDSGNATTYDGDLVDLNLDGYPDLIRTESLATNTARVSVYRNLQGEGTGGTGRTWFDLRNPSDFSNVSECPDDIDFGDLNNDGWTDFVVARRDSNCVTRNDSSGVSVYINTSADNSDGDISFVLARDLPARTSTASIHDVVLIDANGDDNLDILALNEFGNNELYINQNNGQFPSFNWLNINLGANALTGAAGDLNIVRTETTFPTAINNADNVEGLVLADDVNFNINIYTPVIRNNRFPSLRLSQSIPVPEFSTIYDIELGDFDLDGSTDILINGFSNNTVPASLFLLQQPVAGSNGLRSRFERQPSDVLDNQTNDDFLSGDALDYNLDGDLDVYIAGGDGGSPNGCRGMGCVQNRLFSNRKRQNVTHTNFERGLDNWTQGRSINGDTDTHDWEINEGETTSRNTGPARAKSGASYLYLETSVSGANRAGNTAFLNSPLVELNPSDYRHTLTFDYHMYGSNIGSLHIDLLEGDGSNVLTDVFVLDGEQQSSLNASWKSVSVNLANAISSLNSTSFQVRIRVVAAGSFRGDIAIDNLNITNAQFPDLGFCCI